MINVDLKPLLEKLNTHCNSNLESAAGLCVGNGSFEIGIEHFLLKLSEDSNTDIQIILRHYGIEEAQLFKSLTQFIETEEKGNQRRPVFSRKLIEWVQDAWLLSSVEFGLAEVRSATLFATLILNPRRYGAEDYFNLLEDISAEDLRNNLLDVISGSTETSKRISEAESAVSSADGENPVSSADSALSKFTIHFTQQAREGKIDPVFCRDDEIRQMVDIVSRRRKNNPILVGEPGVGKTAVVEGLALKIVEGDVPDVLQGTELYALDMGLLQAGASVKGEFEKRLKAVIEEVKSSLTPILLFIDEAHTLIGAGGAAGGSDAANLLKPALARGEMKTLAATTWSEYKKYFEKDPALARRFQLVKIGEPSAEDAIVIMRGLREKYEESHSIYVRDDAVVASAVLSDRYISGRQLPDKSVDLLDTACARVKVSMASRPEQLTTLDEEIRILKREQFALQRDIESGVNEDDGRNVEITTELETLGQKVERFEQQWQKETELIERITGLRKSLAGDVENEEGETLSPEKIKQELATLEKQLDQVQGEDPLVLYEVSADAVSKVVADWTGIPVGNMVKDEAQTILTFAESLQDRIKGQDHAVDAIDRKVRAAKAGLGNPDAPMAVMLFVGPSGVGKTESALGIADQLFGGERFTITINMSEFQEKHSVSRLVGSPPGYVGYGEGGLLTEAVRQRPYSVVLLDECEKADPEVMNLFYQVFDKGTLTDGEGREVNFRNTVIIMTSNLATDTITTAALGEERPSLDQLTELIRPELSRHFKPALLARMEIVPFYPLNPEALELIVRLKLDKLGKRLEQSQQIKFDYDETVIKAISTKCTEVETGARNIDHIINKNLLPNISTEILKMMADEEMPETLKVAVDENMNFVYAFVNEAEAA